MLAECHAMKHKMLANEKEMKNNAKEKADAIHAVQAAQKLLQETRQDGIKSGNLLAQYKQMHHRSQGQCEGQLLQISKLRGQLDKSKEVEEMAEKLVEKLQLNTDRKNVIIMDQDMILAELEAFASADI